MAARAGMAQLILDARVAANAGTADYTVNGVAYWTDDQLQATLDAYRETHKAVPLLALADDISGTATYTEYRIPRHIKNIEGTATGWALRDGTGTDAPSYTANLPAGVITFDSDTGGTSYYLSCREYNVNRAVADIWDQKAAFVAANVDWASDNHRMNASQEAEAYRKRAEQFRSMGGPRFSVRVRTDERN